MTFEPGVGRRPFVRVVRPAHRNDFRAPRTRERPPAGRVKHIGVSGVVDDRGIDELESQRLVPPEAVRRLKHCSVRQIVIDIPDPPVDPIVYAAVDTDRAVDTMHHATAGADKAAEPVEIEIERVVETRGRAGRDPIVLQYKAAPDELLA